MVTGKRGIYVGARLTNKLWIADGLVLLGFLQGISFLFCFFSHVCNSLVFAKFEENGHLDDCGDSMVPKKPPLCFGRSLNESGFGSLLTLRSEKQ